MKNLFTTIPAMLLLLSITQAQTINTISNRLQQVSKRNASLMHAIEARQGARLAAAKGSAAKTTNAAEHLVAQSAYDIEYNLGLTDSTYYTYSNNRGSTYDFNDMDYSDGIYSLQGALPMDIAYGNNTVYHNYYLNVLCDSAKYYHYYTADSAGLSLRLTMYDANNNVAQFYDPYTQDASISYEGNRVVNTYDANQNLTQSVVLGWNFGNWDTAAKRILTYNGNMLASDTSSLYSNGTWAPEYAFTYAYDNNNNITHVEFYGDSAGIWLALEQYFLSYSADNILQQDSTMIYTSGAWYPYATDSVGYTSGVSYTTYERENVYSSIDGVADHYLLRTKYTSAGLPDSILYNQYDMATNTIQTGDKLIYTYDSYGNPLTMTQYQYNTGTVGTDGYSTTPDFADYYYYQLFNTAVSNVAKPNISITIFPNPTTNELNIAQTGMQQGALTYITIINALGQTVRTESLPFINGTETLSVAGLTPGNYWLLIQDKTGNILSRQTIVKE
jgi:hypothetical protein